MSTPSSNTRRKGTKFAALFAAGSIALAACSTATDEPADDSPASEGGTIEQTITDAQEQEFAAYNNNTNDQNAVRNTVVLNQVLRGFWYFGEDGSVVPDTEFGTYEKTSDDPLTVNYTFADDAVWSDGEPIDCDDFLLAYVAGAGTLKTGTVDEEGNEVSVFQGTEPGYDLQEKPTCEDGDKEIEVVYTEPFADWEGQYGAFMPAHIVEQQAGIDDIIPLIESDDAAGLAPAGEFWNSGWILQPGTLPADILPSSGPYMLDSWTAGQSLTLVVNDQWWGTPPAASTIVFRFLSGEQQAQALQNGEVDIITPQPQVDVIDQLEAIGETVAFSSGDEYTYEHVDFNFTGVFADPELREAFAKCLPRQQIIDNLIKPVNPEAIVMNSRYDFPFQEQYEDTVAATNAADYSEVDVAGARAILEAKGAVGTPVRIGYQQPNPRRTSQVQLIADSCNQAGFAVSDAGTTEFFGTAMPALDFDVALFAWSGSPLVTGSSTTFVTPSSAADYGNNNGRYSNPQVDELTAQLNVTPDVDEQHELVKQIEAILWEDLATVPLFAHPGIEAYASNVQNVKFQPSQTGVTWNMQEWTKQ